MKKVSITISILLLFSFVSPFTSFANEEITDYELTQSALKTALYPHIVEEIKKYQFKNKTYAPFHLNWNLFEAKILNVKKKPNETAYLVKVRLHTFEHAHSPPHFEVTTTIEVSLRESKVVKSEILKDREAKKIEEFYRKAISDIVKSFSLDLKTYKVYNSVNVPNGLRDTITSVIKNILNPEIHPPYKNVIDPVTFLKADQGYILFKKSDGTNIVYTVKKEDNKWRVINIREKKGKKMEEKLIWYM